MLSEEHLSAVAVYLRRGRRMVSSEYARVQEAADDRRRATRMLQKGLTWKKWPGVVAVADCGSGAGGLTVLLLRPSNSSKRNRNSNCAKEHRNCRRRRAKTGVNNRRDASRYTRQEQSLARTRLALSYR